MFAVTGITGQVGGAVARNLLRSGFAVRAVVRDPGKAKAWTDLGCEVAVAALDDPETLAAAFRGAEGVFFLLPPCFDPLPGFPEARRIIGAVSEALAASRPSKIVSLSTIGAQAQQPNLLQQHQLQEQSLAELGIPITFLRAAWFMENAAWDVASARQAGLISSFLFPPERKVPMIATADVGRVAADILQESWTGRRVVELVGQRVSPNDIAETFGRLLGREVRVEIVPRSTWEELFRTQGMKNPLPRIQMLDGFNEGSIDFEGKDVEQRLGKVLLETVLSGLLERSSP